MVKSTGAKHGIVTSIQFTEGGLGNQYTTIDGEVYATWFDLRELPVTEGCKVEYQTYKRDGFRCLAARILRVITADAC